MGPPQLHANGRGRGNGRGGARIAVRMAAAGLLAFLVAGCFGEVATPPVPASSAFLLDKGVSMVVGPGWSAFTVSLDDAFWSAAEDLPYHEGLHGTISTNGADGYYLVGVRLYGPDGPRPVGLLGGANGGFTLRWDPDDVGHLPRIDLLVLGGASQPGRLTFYLGEKVPSAPVAVQPIANGTQGAGGTAMRIHVSDLVLKSSTGAVAMEETYAPGAHVGVGFAVPERITRAWANGTLENKGVLAFYIANLDPAGAATWSYELQAGEHQSAFAGGGGSPGATLADASPTRLQTVFEGGEIDLDYFRRYSGAVDSVTGRSVFVMHAAWADMDLEALGWDVPTVTPESYAQDRAFELLPMDPPAGPR